MPRAAIALRRIAGALLLAAIDVGVGAAAAPGREAAGHEPVERAFRAWIAGPLWTEAAARKVSRRTFDAALGTVTLDWELPDLLPPGAPPPGARRPSGQAEFGSPGAYFNEARLKSLVAGGRERLTRHSAVLAAVERRYGVPREILVAIWGRESGYGRAALPKSALRVLATQAFMGRRKDYFRGELLAALDIVERGDIAPSRMTSSWAGALGQPQFMPSMLLRYAVDFDGDGRRDIWDSVPDTLASIAHYLAEEGWQPGRPWGVEASVPAAVSCTLEGPEQGMPGRDWTARGVVGADGRGLQPGERDRPLFMVMPAGRKGPGFLVSQNFYVLKQYNNSDLYALFIGHLADRFAADRPFAGAWVAPTGLTRSDVEAMQRALVAGGQDVGRVDGLVGFKTRIAIGRWQARAGRSETCFPDAALVNSVVAGRP